jgi:hypothetical protein
MDEELKHLEAELRQLRPAAPSAGLQARVARALANAAPAPTTTAVRPSSSSRVGNRAAPVHWLWSAALPVAAAFAVVAMMPHGREATSRGGLRRGVSPTNSTALASATPADGAVLKPVAAEKVLYAAQDEGLVTLEDGTTARRERLSYVDTITWKNPRTNASLTWSVPREEVRVVPVSFQ